MKPKLVVEQKINIFTNKYCVYESDGVGNRGKIVAFAQQKRLAFKEKVRFYTDESKAQEVFSFRAEKVLDIHGRFFVEDPGGNVIGIFKKDFEKSLLSSTWHVLDPQGNPRITISESNVVLAILRRFAGFIPIVGEFIDFLIVLFRYHFVWQDSASGNLIGKYQKTTLFRDHYLLSMSDEAIQQTDWRVLAAVSVALDALQSR